MTATRRDNDPDLDLDDLNLGEDDPLLSEDHKLDDPSLDDLDSDVLDDDFEEPAPRPKKRQSVSLLTMVLMLVLVVVGGAFLLLNNQSVTRAIPMASTEPVPSVPEMAATPVTVPGADVPVEPSSDVTEGVPSPSGVEEVPQPDPQNNNLMPTDVATGVPSMPPTSSLDGAKIEPPSVLETGVPPQPAVEAPALKEEGVSPEMAPPSSAPVPSASVANSVPVVPSDSGLAPMPLVAQDPSPTVSASVDPKIEPLVSSKVEPQKPEVKETVKEDGKAVKAAEQEQSKPVVPTKQAVVDSPKADVLPVEKSSAPKEKEGVVAKVQTPPADKPMTKEKQSSDDYYSANETVETLSRMTENKSTLNQVGLDGRKAELSVVSQAGSNPESELEAANRAIDLERYDAALEMFDKLYRQNKSDERILMGRAVALQKLGRNDEAIKAYDELLAQNPDNPTVMTNMLGLVRKQYPSVALQRLLELRQRYPQNPTVAAQAGLAQASIGNLEEGLRYLGIAAGLEPENPKHYFNMGVIAERLGKPELAIDSYEKALQADALGSDTKATVDRDVIYDRLSVLRQKM